MDIVDFSDLLNFMGLSPSGYDGHQLDYGCHKCLRDSRRAGSELWFSMLPVLYWEPRSYHELPNHMTEYVLNSFQGFFLSHQKWISSEYWEFMGREREIDIHIHIHLHKHKHILYIYIYTYCVKI